MITIKPWIGARYEAGFAGKKVLILGESFYSEEGNASENIAIDIISDLFDEKSEFEPYKNTFTKFVKAMLGKDTLSVQDKKLFWNSVAFYNFVQIPMSAARVSPSKEDFQSSAEAFFEVLDSLKPDVCIVWGARLYNNLPKGGMQGPDFKAPDGRWIESWKYFTSDRKEVLIFPVMHPSSSFSPEYWYEVLSLVI